MSAASTNLPTPDGPGSVSGRRNSRILYRFQARDLHLVMGPVPCAPRRAAHGTDVDDQGNGTVADPRLYQLVRQPGPVTDRTFETTFLHPGVRAYAFTFG